MFNERAIIALIGDALNITHHLINPKIIGVSFYSFCSSDNIPSNHLDFFALYSMKQLNKNGKEYSCTM